MDRRRPDSDEIVELGRPRPPFRPDHGYRVGARITSGNPRNPRLAASIALGIVLVGMALNAIGPFLPPAPALPVAPDPTRFIATPLPDVAILRPPGPSGYVPVTAGGIRWLDPATGAMTGDAYSAPRGGIFVDGLGRALCVCLEVPWSADRTLTRVVLRWFSATGEEQRRSPLYELAASTQRVFGDQIQVEAALSPDGTRLWIARAVRLEAEWEVGIDRVDLASASVEASRIVARIATPAPADAALGRDDNGWIVHPRSGLRAQLRVTPAGDGLALTLAMTADPRLDADLVPFQVQRLVLPSDLSSDPLVALAVHDATTDGCDIERAAWATDRDFVTVCNREDGRGVQPYVRIETSGSGTREVELGPPVLGHDLEFLLDADAGAVLRWSTLGHVLSRLDVRSGDVSSVEIDRALATPRPTGRWPVASRDGPAWAPLAGPDPFIEPARAIGSPDGLVVYALGFQSRFEPDGDERLASTGIWIFDARAVELVGHWEPEALYGQIGLAAGGARLVTVAPAGTTAAGEPADWSTSMWFHDAGTGQVVGMLGDIQEPSGFLPALLAPNAPAGIAGF